MLKKNDSPALGLPTVAVITSTFNAGRYLEGLIKSVTSQTYPNVEFIIIDAGSTDNTLEIIQKHKDQITYWISERDKGIYDAWNKALKKTEADWICFLGADDFFVDQKVLESIYPQLVELELKNRRYLYGKINQVSEVDLKIIDVLGDEWLKSKKDFRNEMTLAHCGSFHHKNLFKENGFFNTDFKIAGDYEFLLREYCRDENFAQFIPITVVNMRTGGISGSLKNRLLMAKETNKARKLNGFKRNSLTVSLWILRIRIYILLKKIFGDGITNRLADIYRLLKGKKKRWSINSK